MPPRLSVVIPAYNEAPALRRLLPELKRYLPELSPCAHEILVVDDGSTDETPVLVEAEGVRLIRHARRCGSGAGRKSGSKAATGEFIAWLDGDGTYPAKALGGAFRELGDADQVIGVRSTDNGRMRGVRLAVKRAFSYFAGRLWQTPIPDLNSGLRVIRRTALSAWIDELPDGFSCTSTATLAALNHGQRIAFVPIDYRPRAPGTQSKFHPVWDTLRLGRTIWRMWRRKRRHLVQRPRDIQGSLVDHKPIG